MLRPFCLLSLFFFTILAFNCSNNKSNDASWIKEGYEGKQYKKLAVVCVNESKKVRKKFRKRIVKALKAKSINAVSGKDIFPEGLTDADKDPTHLVSRLNAQDVDGILAVFILREQQPLKKDLKVKNEGVYWVGKFVYRRLTIDHQDDQEIEEKEDEQEDDFLESFSIETVLHDVSPDLTRKKETLVWMDDIGIEKDSTTKFVAQQFADNLAIQLVDIDQVVQSLAK